MTIFVSGSLAFDRLSDFSGLFRDSILEDKLDILNVCFLVGKVVRFHGGTAGNIAYNLFLLGEKPIIISTVGDDADGADYLKRIRTDWGLSDEAIKIAKGYGSSGVYIVTDKSDNQLSFFTPGAMEVPSDYDLSIRTEESSKNNNAFDPFAIVSPGCFLDMKNLVEDYKARGIPVILDPGQQTPVFSGDELLKMLSGVYLLITNEYELDLILKKTNSKDPKDLLQWTSAIVTTMGAKGSSYMTKDETRHIKAVPVAQVVNPTGAGDGYRAGFMKAIYSGNDLLTACEFGAAVSSFCVESRGVQEHSFSLQEALSRYKDAFGKELKL
jgi:adenosine kinase